MVVWFRVSAGDGGNTTECIVNCNLGEMGILAWNRREREWGEGHENGE